MKKSNNQVSKKNTFYLLIIFFLICFFLKPIYSESLLDITEDDLFIGNTNAPITMIEYASLSCSHCANFHTNTLPKLVEEYVGTGKIRIVFRDFPFNYPALLGSMVLKCIDNDIRYQYLSVLYQLQSKWVVKENKQTKKELYKIMQSGGMSKEQFDKCLSNTDHENTILQGLMNAQSEYNIKSTPSFLINGNLVEGNKSIKEWRKIIDNLLIK